MSEIPDTSEAMEAKETARTLPLGWRLLFWGLIAWGVAYFWLYSPATSGWTQAGEYEKATAAPAAPAK